MAISDELLEEWDYDKNGDPNNYTRGSNKKVSWICKNNVCGCHVWDARVSNRANGNGCPYCSGRSACIHTSIVTTHPELVEEWDYSKNTIHPSQVSAGSGEKVSWICKSGACGCHVWDAPVYSRTSGAGCPYCSNQKVCIHSSLVSTHPDLAEEWGYSKNTILPSQVSKGYDKKVSWICKKKHTWDATVCNRTRGNGCPRCSHTGYSKKACRWIESIMISQNISTQYAKSPEGEYTLPDLSSKSGRNIKVDGYCHSTNTVYEFHGDMWHGNPRLFDPADTNPLNYRTYGDLYTSTLEKDAMVRRLGYTLVVMWEQDYVDDSL